MLYVRTWRLRANPGAAPDRLRALEGLARAGQGLSPGYARLRDSAWAEVLETGTFSALHQELREGQDLGTDVSRPVRSGASFLDRLLAGCPPPTRPACSEQGGEMRDYIVGCEGWDEWPRFQTRPYSVWPVKSRCSAQRGRSDRGPAWKRANLGGRGRVRAGVSTDWRRRRFSTSEHDPASHFSSPSPFCFAHRCGTLRRCDDRRQRGVSGHASLTKQTKKLTRDGISSVGAPEIDGACLA